LSARHESSGTRPGGRFASRRAAAGFTFAEVLVATLVAGTMLVTATSALSATVDTKNALATQPAAAFALAREIQSLALTLPHTAGDGSPASTGAGVLLLEDLDGAAFSPPINAGRCTISTSAGWTQVVAIDSVDLSSPTTLAADPTSTSTLLRLTVTVLEGRETRGTYTWWLNP